MKTINRLKKNLSRILRLGRAPKPAQSKKKTARIDGENRSALIAGLAELGERPTHGEVLTLLETTLKLTDRERFRYLRSLLAQRKIAALEDILKLPSINEPLRTYMTVQIADYRGLVALQSSEVFSYFTHNRHDKLLGRNVTRLGIEQAIRLEDSSLLLRVLSELSEEQLRNIPRAVIAGAVRTLFRHGQKETAANVLRSFLEGAAPEGHLNFLDTKVMLGVTPAAPWRQVLEQFATVECESDERKRFSGLVVEGMRRIPEGAGDLMDIRFFAEQRNHIGDVIRDAIKLKRPLAMIRICDGEAYAYPGLPGMDITRDNAMREIHWWAQILDESMASEIKAGVRAAAAEADIIGFPSIYRIIRDQGRSDAQFALRKPQRALAGLLFALGRDLPTEGKIFTEERCNHILFTRQNLEEWASLARKVIVIACWDGEKIDMSLGAQTEWIAVPPQRKLQHAAGDVSDEALPFIYQDIITKLSNVERGDLVLVGAGVIGKMFIAEARRRGAVALDVGSVFDYQAGFSTRSIIEVD